MSWFSECRYGMSVHMNIASVPAFAPVHEYSDWYWSHMSSVRLPDAILHPQPLPEVQAWHEEHYGAGFTFDEFIPELTLSHWDPDGVAELTVAAGMRYVVPVSKHHDGFCWWDSALTDRTSVHQGPKRDVVAELAEAARKRGLFFGLYYSLLDWSHPGYGNQKAYVDDYMRPQIRELVERFEPSVLWGDGHWGKPGEHWRSDEILSEYRSIMKGRGLEALVNDRWNAGEGDFITYEYDTPVLPPGRPFEVCRGLAHSFCYNRAEEDDDHLTAQQLVALLTETVAKGGNLLINVGPRRDGSIPAAQENVLRQAGEWVRGNAGVIHGSKPFDVWGDANTRYTVSGNWLNAIDLSTARERVFPALTPDRGLVTAVAGDVDFQQDQSGLRIVRRSPDPRGAGALASVYRVEWLPLGSGGPAVRRMPMRWIGRALSSAAAGETVVVRPGRYTADTETFPLVVPPGVTLRGEEGAVIDASRAQPGQVALILGGDGAGVEDLEIVGPPAPTPFLPATAVMSDGDGPVVARNCTITGGVTVDGGAGHEISGNKVNGGSIWLRGASGSVVSGNRQSRARWGVGIWVTGGSGHVIEENVLEDDLAAIRLVGTTDCVVRSNHCSTRWWGIHLERATGTRVHDNGAARTMRAITLTGGAGNVIRENSAVRCDTGLLLEEGPTGTAVIGNRMEGCRVGLMLWEEEDTSLRGNRVSESRQLAAYLRGTADLSGNDVKGVIRGAPRPRRRLRRRSQ